MRRHHYKQYMQQYGVAPTSNSIVSRYERISHGSGIWTDVTANAASGVDGGSFTGGAPATSWPVFDGGAFVNVGQPSKMDFAGAFSISFWVKQSTAAPAGWERVIARPGAYLGNEVDSTGACAGFLYRTAGSGGGTQSVTTGANTPLGVWRFVTFVNEGTGNDLVIYVDGAESARAAGVGGVMNPVAVDLYLGNQPSLASGLQGELDTARFYSRALSAAEISRDYNAGKPAHP